MALNDTLILIKCGGFDRLQNKQPTNTSKTQTKMPTRRKRERDQHKNKIF